MKSEPVAAAAAACDAQAPGYAPHDPNDALHGGAHAVVERERRHLLAWRGRAPDTGLALSGGGIRSASYCLGVLQALAHERCLPEIDYLSTVSGGGYIGASLSYLLSPSAQTSQPAFDASRERFPYLSYPMVDVPPPARAEAAAARQKGRLLRRLRQNANYLAPGNGITFLSLAGVLLRNLAASALVHVACLVLLLQGLVSAGLLVPARVFDAGGGGSSGGWPWQTLPDRGYHLLLLALGVFALYALLSVGYVLLTGAFVWMEQRERRAAPGRTPDAPTGAYALRRLYDRWAHRLLALAAVVAVVGALPWAVDLMAQLHLTSLRGWVDLFTPDAKNKPALAGVAATVLGVLGNVWGLLQTRSAKKPRIPPGLIITVACALLLFGMLLLAFLFTGWLNARVAQAAGHAGLAVFGWIAGLTAVVLALFGAWPNTNYLSLHRFYRDRLMELFLPDLRKIHASLDDVSDAGVIASPPGDSALLGNLCGVDHGVAAHDAASAAARRSSLLHGPYQLINANVVLVASKHPRYRGRGGDNFLLSPLHCGSRATGWKHTDATPGSGLTLATAMAMSGAAVSPNAGPGGEGFTRQPVLSVLMGMLNLRLGYWLRNPDPAAASPWWARLVSRRKCPGLIAPGLFESFGRRNLHEHERTLLLTDGGHFENLALYELVRRRLKLIIVCDATADPEFKFVDLANAIEKARADFGAMIELRSEDLAALVPQQPAAGKASAADTGVPMAQRGYVIAPIRYAPRDALADNGGAPPEQGLLIYLKATFFKDLLADLHGYRRTHPSFPNQSTGDQFFNEKQFEAYRELGYQTAWLMLQDLRAAAHGGGQTLRSDAARLLWPQAPRPAPQPGVAHETMQIVHVTRM
jgi:predicted acylesterase/phospholipase RssA